MNIYNILFPAEIDFVGWVQFATLTKDKRMVSLGYSDFEHIEEKARNTKIHKSQNYYIMANSVKRFTKRSGESGIRTIPMLEPVRNALLSEKKRQEENGTVRIEIDGYSDWTFTNRYGTVMQPSSINRAIKRIIKSYNDEETTKAQSENREPVLLPDFSAHTMRHTFCTRMCEVEPRVKIIQVIMGHSDIQTTMDIYNTVTDEVKFIRFALAKGVITYGLELMLKLMVIVQGVISKIMTASGIASSSSTALPQSIIDAIEDCGFWESIPLWAVTLIGGLFITVLSFIMIMSVYGRFFKIYMYSAIAPVPLSTFAGQPTENVGKTFLKSYCAVLLEGAIIVLACVIFSVFASSPPTVDTSTAAVTQVWSYVGELIFNMLVLVGSVKMADRIVREMMGL